jgi:hypothetical protein
LRQRQTHALDDVIDMNHLHCNVAMVDPHELAALDLVYNLVQLFAALAPDESGPQDDALRTRDVAEQPLLDLHLCLAIKGIRLCRIGVGFADIEQRAIALQNGFGADLDEAPNLLACRRPVEVERSLHDVAIEIRPVAPDFDG